MGYVSFFENFVQITVLMIAWSIVVISFFILAVQLFITLIEFSFRAAGNCEFVCRGWCRRNSCWNWLEAISDGLRLSDHAARSMI
jgi:hypothetical protein